MDSRVYADLKELVRLKHQAQGFSFLPKQPIHSILAGRHASRIRGRGLNFEEVRAYLPGDDIRNIDWKVTARTREPHTRVYTEERDRAALLLVDQRINMFFGSQMAMKSVTAAETAALGAWRVLAAGDRVGGIVFGDDNMTEVRPHRSNKRVMELLNAVTRHNHRLRVGGSVMPEPKSLNAALRKATRVANHDCLITLISDMDGYDSETEDLLGKLGRHNDVLVVLIYDPLETELPDMGKLVIGDGKLQIEFDSGDATLRRSFSEAFNADLEGRRQMLIRHGTPVLPVHTAAAVAGQVRALLGYKPPQGLRL